MATKTNPLWQQIYTRMNGLDHGLDSDNFDFLIKKIAEEVQQNVKEEIVVEGSVVLTHCGKAKISFNLSDEDDVANEYIFEISIPSFTKDGSVTVTISPLDKLPCGRLLTDYIDNGEDKKRKIKTFKVALDRGVKAIAAAICKYFPEYADIYDEAKAERNKAGAKIEKVKSLVESLAIAANADVSADGMSFLIETEDEMRQGSVNVVSTETGQLKLEFFTDNADELGKAISFLTGQYQVL